MQNQVFVEQMTASLAEKESALEKAYRVTESRFRVIEMDGNRGGVGGPCGDHRRFGDGDGVS